VNVYALEFPLHKPGVDLFHYLQFHGIQASQHERVCAPVMGDPHTALVLVHNARSIPRIFSPQSALVVSEAVTARLPTLAHCELRPIRFQRVVDFPHFAPGSHDYKRTAAYEQAVRHSNWEERIFDYLPTADPALAATVSGYFELVPTLLKDAAGAFPAARPVRCERPCTVDRTNELLLSPELVEAFPVTWWGQYVLHERVYQAIADDLDPSYAEVVEINL
jgi:hypothetical protein